MVGFDTPDPQAPTPPPRFDEFVADKSASTAGVKSSNTWGAARSGHRHQGQDFGGSMNSPVGSADDGEIVFAGPNGNMGNAVKVKHPDGTVSVYGHLNKINVQQGDRVKAGASIGLLGQTGNAKGPHVHFELYQNGLPIDPAGTKYRPQIGSQQPEVPPRFDDFASKSGSQPKSYDTQLSPQEETRFQSWKQQYAPNDAGADYDLRGAFKAGLVPDSKTGHWPDTFKKPNHPTFSNESQYAVGDDAAKAGHWEGDKFIPADSAPPRFDEFVKAQQPPLKTPRVTSSVKEVDTGTEIPTEKPPTPIAFQPDARPNKLPGTINPLAIFDSETPKAGRTPGIKGLQAAKLQTPPSTEMGAKVKLPFSSHLNPTEDDVVNAYLDSLGPQYASMGKQYKEQTGHNILTLGGGQLKRESDGSFYIRPSRGAINFINSYIGSNGDLSKAAAESQGQKDELIAAQNKAVQDAAPDVAQARAATETAKASPTLRGMIGGAAPIAQEFGSVIPGPLGDEFERQAAVERAAVEQATKEKPLQTTAERLKAGVGAAIPTAMNLAATKFLGPAQLPVLGALQGQTAEERLRGFGQGAAAQVGLSLAPSAFSAAGLPITGKAVTGAAMVAQPATEAWQRGESPVQSIAENAPFAALPFLHGESRLKGLADQPLGIENAQRAGVPGEATANINQTLADREASVKPLTPPSDVQAAQDARQSALEAQRARDTAYERLKAQASSEPVPKPTGPTSKAELQVRAERIQRDMDLAQRAGGQTKKSRQLIATLQQQLADTQNQIAQIGVVRYRPDVPDSRYSPTPRFDEWAENESGQRFESLSPEEQVDLSNRYRAEFGEQPPPRSQRDAPPLDSGATNNPQSEPVRHVDLQARRKRGEGKGTFRTETKAEAEARWQQVSQSVAPTEVSAPNEPATSTLEQPPMAEAAPVATSSPGVSVPPQADTATEISQALNFAGDRHFVAKFLESSPLKAKVLAEIPEGSVLAGPDARMPERQGGPIRLRAPDGVIREIDTGDAHKGDPDWKPIGRYTEGFAVRKVAESAKLSEAASEVAPMPVPYPEPKTSAQQEVNRWTVGLATNSPGYTLQKLREHVDLLDPSAASVPEFLDWAHKTLALSTPPAPPVPEGVQPPPLGGAKVSGFTTSQGSTYAVDGESTQRTKSLHKMHDPNDVGLKKPSQRTVYVSPEDATRIGQHNTLNKEARAKVELTDEGIVLTNKWGREPDGRTYTKTKREVIPYTSSPEVGKAPVEFFKGGSNHPGNEITNVESAPLDGVEPQTQPFGRLRESADPEGEFRAAVPKEEHASADRLATLIEKSKTGALYDKIIHGQASDSEVGQFRKIAKDSGVSDSHIEAVIGEGKRTPEQPVSDTAQGAPTEGATETAGLGKNLSSERGSVAFGHIADTLIRTVQNAQDFVTVEPTPKLKRAGVAAEAREHASARTAVPYVVRDLLSKVFPDDYANPKEMSRTIDILNKDNVLGGYDTFLKNAADARAAGRDSEADQWQARADAVGSAQDIAKLEADVAKAQKDKKLSTNIDRWKKIVNPEMDRLYNEMKRVDPSTQREGRGRVFGARINLLPGNRALEMASFADQSKPMPEAVTSNYRNPNVKRDPFMRSAKLTGRNYSTDAQAVLTNVLGPRLNEVTKLRLYDALVRKGVAVETEPGEAPPKDIQGQKTSRLAIKVPQTSDVTGKTTIVEKNLYVRADLASEIRNVLNTDMKMPSNPMAKPLTQIQLAQLTDMTAHLKNVHSVLATAPATRSAWTDALRRMPVIGTVDSVTRIVGVTREIMSDSPKIRAEMADMAKMGLIRPEYPLTGIQKITRGQQIIHTVDTASRVIMNRFFDNMLEAGRVKDTPENRASFVQQIGEYNSRLMGRLMRGAKESGFSPFVVAGRNFNRQAVRQLTGAPGVEASSLGEAAKMRAVNITSGLVAASVLPALLNVATTGSMGGRAGTPIGAWDLGKDEENGRHRVIDLMQIIGLRRGLRATGANALVEGMRQGQSMDEILGHARDDVASTAAHPWIGPALGFAYQSLTGRRIDLRGGPEPPVAQNVGGGGRQTLENARTALEAQNPLLYGALSPLIGTEEDKQDSYLKRLGKGLAKGPTSAFGVQDLQSPASKLVGEINREKGAFSRTPDQVTTRRIRNDLTSRARKGEDVEDYIQKAVDAGQLTAKQAKDIGKNKDMSGLAVQVKYGLTLDDALRVWDRATLKERADMMDVISKKAGTTLGKLEDGPVKDALQAQLDKRGIEPIAKKTSPFGRLPSIAGPRVSLPAPP